MARRKLDRLERVLGVNALVSTAYGNVGSSIYYALGLVAAYALGWTPVVFLLAGGLFFCTAATYAEATAAFPEAGGSSLFVRKAFNELWSFFTAWAQMLNYTITIAISAFYASGYFASLVGGSLESPGAKVAVAIAIVVALAFINVRGVQDAVSVNVVLSALDFLSQLGLVVLGLVLVFDPAILVRNLEFVGTAPTWSNLLIAIPVGTVAYTGIETISNMAGEARDETKTIPAAVKRVVIATFAVCFTLPWIAVSALPMRCDSAGENCTTLLGVSSDEGGFAQEPMLGIVKAMDLGPLEPAGLIYVGVLAVTILIAAANAGVLGVSRLVYSMGIHRQMPDGMRRLHQRYGTPYIGIFVFSAVACVAIAPGQAGFLGSIYAFGAMLSFTMAHLSVIRLRVIAPDLPRPYRSPGNVRIAGHDLPPLALIGIAGTVFSLLIVSLLDLAVAAAGIGWLVVGGMVYYVYRRRAGLDLTSTYKVAIVEPVVEREAEYDSVLVYLGDDGFDGDLMAIAGKLAVQRRRGIHVLITITVPNELDIDAPLAGAQERADSTIEQAKLAGGARVSGHWEKVRANGAGRRIVEEAQDMHAAAVVMRLPKRVPGGSAFGKTVETVLSERPCRVIIEAGSAQ